MIRIFVAIVGFVVLLLLLDLVIRGAERLVLKNLARPVVVVVPAPHAPRAPVRPRPAAPARHFSVSRYPWAAAERNSLRQLAGPTAGNGAGHAYLRAFALAKAGRLATAPANRILRNKVYRLLLRAAHLKMRRRHLNFGGPPAIALVADPRAQTLAAIGGAGLIKARHLAMLGEQAEAIGACRAVLSFGRRIALHSVYQRDRFIGAHIVQQVLSPMSHFDLVKLLGKLHRGSGPGRGAYPAQSDISRTHWTNLPMDNTSFLGVSDAWHTCRRQFLPYIKYGPCQAWRSWYVVDLGVLAAIEKNPLRRQALVARCKALCHDPHRLVARTARWAVGLGPIYQQFFRAHQGTVVVRQGIPTEPPIFLRFQLRPLRFTPITSGYFVPAGSVQPRQFMQAIPISPTEAVISPGVYALTFIGQSLTVESFSWPGPGPHLPPPTGIFLPTYGPVQAQLRASGFPMH